MKEIDTNKLTKVIWSALKQRCSYNPVTAKRIVLLNEADVKAALENSVDEIKKLLETP